MIGRLGPLLLTLSATCLGAGQVRFQVQDLGTLPAGRSAVAAGINASGWVVGTSSGAAIRGFRWPAQGPLLDVGNLPGGVHTRAMAINRRNEIAGASGDSGFLIGGDGVMRAIRSATTAGTIPAAVNDEGTVVGAAFFGSRTRAFRWSRSAGLRDLGTLPGGDFSMANAIDHTGRIAGESATPQGRRAFLWTSGTGTRNLGTLGGTYSTASGIWNGEVVGAATNLAGVRLPYRWTPALGMRALPLPMRATSGEATAIGSYGIVGRYWDASGNSRAFLWTSVTGTRDLTELLEPTTTGWTLLTATALNQMGQIVGTGDERGLARAYLLTPAGTLRNFSLESERIGGNDLQASAELAEPALPGGALITLQSSHIAAMPDRTVKIAAGAKTARFRVATAGVERPVWVRITASAGVSRREVQVRILPAALQSVALSPANIKGGERTSLTVTLNGSAPPAGLVLRLTASHPNLVTLPSNITLRPNERSATLELPTRSVTGRTVITLEAAQGSLRRSTTLTLTP